MLQNVNWRSQATWLVSGESKTAVGIGIETEKELWRCRHATTGMAISKRLQCGVMRVDVLPS